MRLGIGTSLGDMASTDELGVPPGPAPALLLSVGGQSNSRKAGNSGGTPAEKYTDLGETYIWDAGAGAWTAYVCGATSGHRGGPDSGVWGSEAEFVHLLRESGGTQPVYILKEAVNGQSLAPAGGGDWAPQATGERYDGYVAQALSAKSELAALEVAVEEVFLWNQGEADSNDLQSAADYQENLEELLASLAADGAFGSNGMFIIERIRPCSADLSTSTYGGQFMVREAQERVAATDPRVRIVSLDFDESNFGSLHPAEPWCEGCGTRCHAAYAGTYATAFGPVLATSPDSLGFVDQSDVAPGTEILSAQLTPGGLGGHAALSISGGDAEYRVLNPDGSVWLDWGSAPGTIHPFQGLQLRMQSSANLSASVSTTITVGGASAEWSVSTYAQAPSLESETDAFIAQVTANGGATLSGADAAALNSFFLTAKASGWWSKIARLYLSCADTVSSSLDLVGQSLSLVQAGSLATNDWVWTGGVGWSGLSDANGGLDLQFAPSSDWSQDSGAFGLWYAALAENTRGDLTSDTGDSYLRATTAGAARFLLNSSANENVSGLQTEAGLRAVVRDGAASIRLHGPEGAVIASGTTTSSASSAAGLYVGNPSGAHSDAVVRGAFVANSALTTAELAELDDAATLLMSHFLSL